MTSRKESDLSIRAVFFDLGDTLWHFPSLPPFEIIRNETVRRINDLLRSWGIEPQGELVFLGRDIRFAMEAADREAYHGDLISPHIPTLAKKVAAEKGLTVTDEQAVQLWHTWNLGGAFLGRTVFEDAHATLDWLRERGYRLGAVTNRHLGGPVFREEMRRYGLLHYFEVLSISCDVGYMKPHPRIFRHALENLSLSPEETMMVGDSLRADVRGAQALGMTAVWRRRDSAREDAEGVEPDYVVDSLWELTELPVLV
jgi:HAD superfamily hydrolase (TIGR01549 family)